eukprot:scaffold1514_cov132-Isochrysis_galbana.AAC.4
MQALLRPVDGMLRQGGRIYGSDFDAQLAELDRELKRGVDRLRIPGSMGCTCVMFCSHVVLSPWPSFVGARSRKAEAKARANAI